MCSATCSRFQTMVDNCGEKHINVINMEKSAFISSSSTINKQDATNQSGLVCYLFKIQAQRESVCRKLECVFLKMSSSFDLLFQNKLHRLLRKDPDSYSKRICYHIFLITFFLAFACDKVLSGLLFRAVKKKKRWKENKIVDPLKNNCIAFIWCRGILWFTSMLIPDAQA